MEENQAAPTDDGPKTMLNAALPVSTNYMKFYPSSMYRQTGVHQPPDPVQCL